MADPTTTVTTGGAVAGAIAISIIEQWTGVDGLTLAWGAFGGFAAIMMQADGVVTRKQAAVSVVVAAGLAGALAGSIVHYAQQYVSIPHIPLTIATATIVGVCARGLILVAMKKLPWLFGRKIDQFGGKND